ncbi:MAG TPA: hypothetical protein VIG99_05710 [Myxococcaceae bacterium]|jgi:hypothetical protein
MRTQVLAALVAGGALLGGCATVAEPEQRSLQLTQATRQPSLDVVGPRVDPRTRTGAVEVAGSAPALAENRAPTRRADEDEPERQQALLPIGIGGSGLPGH